MYIIWGAYHGALLVIHKSIRKVWRLPEAMRGRPEVRAFNTVLTFALIVIGFTFFRATSLETVATMASQIINDFHPDVAAQFVEGYLLIVLAIALGYIAHMSPRAWTDGTSGFYIDLPLVMQAMLLAAIIFIVIQTRQSALVPFIYLKY